MSNDAAAAGDRDRPPGAGAPADAGAEPAPDAASGRTSGGSSGAGAEVPRRRLPLARSLPSLPRLRSRAGAGAGAGTGADPGPGEGVGAAGTPISAAAAGATLEAEAGIAARLARQWALIREERRAGPPEIAAGRSNFSRAHVPWGVDLTAAWAWRFLVIAAAAYVVLWLVGFFALVVVPLAIALLIAALATPGVNAMHRVGFPRGLSALLVVIAGLAFLAALLTFAGQQVANGAQDLADQASAGLGEIKDWFRTGPLHASDSQINDYIQRAQDGLKHTGERIDVSNVTEVGSAVGHIFAGFFIVLFSTYFFLADGARIWAWIVRLAPRAARSHVDGSGRVAWISLTQFVRATVIVAAVDAIGVAIGAAVLGVPFVLAIGVLVFLGAFVPMVGATVAGTVAVLVALVDQGPITALLMLAVVIGVQQVEGHILQPFLMGRWVSLHPLGVIVAIGCGVLAAGIAGALVAVPLAAAVNAVGQHLAANTDPGNDPEEELAEDYAERGESADIPGEGQA